jgi:hypothetical protein
MSIQFNPDDKVGQQLTYNLTNELKNRFSIDEDAGDIAEFIVILMASNRPTPDILAEVKSITDIAIDENFIQLVSNEASRLVAEAQAMAVPAQVAPAVAVAPAPAVAQAPQQPSQQPPQQPQQQPNSKHKPQQVRIPDGPKSLASRIQPANRSHGGISKTSKSSRNFESRNFDSRTNNAHHVSNQSNKKSFALQNPQNLEKMLNLPGNNNASKFVSRPSKGRCPDFPYCKNKECELAHPTKNCFAYPNCTNPPGTCNYLHPDEDQELIAKLEKSKKEFHEKKQQELMVQQGSCKFGANCTKDTCPFAHPTPANPKATIATLEWCPSGKTCGDANCQKSHPPPPTAKPFTTEIKQEIALEQCKFGTSCTNYKCPRRHATSAVPCRIGAECRRLDCTFAHPIPELCRFGEKCTNKNCQYQHPQGRSIQPTTWSKDGNNTIASSTTNVTTNRAFAVPEDQVMEQAVQD